MGQPVWHTVSSAPSSSQSAMPLVPFDKMHPEAAVYLPFLLAGRSLEARFDYSSAASDAPLRIQRCWIGEIGT